MCGCGLCDCKPPLFWNVEGVSNPPIDVVSLSQGGEASLRGSLLYLRNEKLEKVEIEQHFCGVDILSGFPLQAVGDIVKVANNLVCEEVLDKQTSLFDKGLYNLIISLVKEKLNIYIYIWVEN